MKKDAGGFDPPIALGLLVGSGQLALEREVRFAVVGELALTGETRPIKEMLAMELAAAEGRDGVLVLAANGEEAAVVAKLSVRPIGRRSEAVRFCPGGDYLHPMPSPLPNALSCGTREICMNRISSHGFP